MFESQLKLTEDSDSQPRNIDWLLVFTTALLAGGAIALAWLIVIVPSYSTYNWEESYMVNSFLTIELIAGHYVYRNTTYKKLVQSLITVLIVPLLLFLILLVTGSVTENIGKILSVAPSK